MCKYSKMYVYKLYVSIVILFICYVSNLIFFTVARLCMCLLGSAYVFSVITNGSNNQWSQVAKLFPSQKTINGQFGSSIFIHDNTIAVGAWLDNGYTGSCKYIYTWENTIYNIFENIYVYDNMIGITKYLNLI